MSDRLSNPPDHGVSILLHLAFPDPEHEPTRRCKLLVIPAIARLVLGNLLAPELSVLARGEIVFGTPVPEASVDEHGDLGAGKGEIRPSAADSLVDPVTHARSPETSPDDEFGRRVPGTYSPHHLASFLACEAVHATGRVVNAVGRFAEKIANRHLGRKRLAPHVAPRITLFGASPPPNGILNQ